MAKLVVALVVGAALPMTVLQPIYHSLSDCHDAKLAILACFFYFPAAILLWMILAVLLSIQERDLPALLKPFSFVLPPKESQAPASPHVSLNSNCIAAPRSRTLSTAFISPSFFL